MTGAQGSRAHSRPPASVRSRSSGIPPPLFGCTKTEHQERPRIVPLNGQGSAAPEPAHGRDGGIRRDKKLKVLRRPVFGGANGPESRSLQDAGECAGQNPPCERAPGRRPRASNPVVPTRGPRAAVDQVFRIRSEAGPGSGTLRYRAIRRAKGAGEHGGAGAGDFVGWPAPPDSGPGSAPGGAGAGYPVDHLLASRRHGRIGSRPGGLSTAAAGR